MPKSRRTWALASRASAAALLAFACGAFAQAPAQEGVGTVTHLSGILSVKRADGSTKILSVKSPIEEGDTLSTEQDTYARVKFKDGADVVLRPDSRMRLDSYKFDQAKPQQDSMIMSMLKGGFRSVTGLIGHRNRDKMQIAAPNATIGIRGTHFGALFCQGDCVKIPTPSGQPPADGLHLDVANGAIVVKNQGGEQVINAGQFGYVQNANTAPKIVPPNQGIQVTMPPAIASNAGGGRTVGASRNDSECAVQ